MAEISLAMAASHTPGLTGWFDKAPEADRRTVRAAYEAIHDAVVESRTDVLLIIGNDHVANAPVADYANFTFGLADRHSGPDEWFKPWLRVADYTLPGRPEVAETLYQGVKDTTAGVRAVRENLRYDDNLSVPVTMARLVSTGVAVVPVLQNCTVPPVPDERTCYAFGRELGEAIAGLPEGLRVGLLASGGLSHEPGGPRYLEIDEKFDRWWLDLLEEGDHDRVLAEATFERMEEAGSGGTAELLSWVVVMGAIGPRRCVRLGYAAVDQWRCGVGAVRWDLSAPPAMLESKPGTALGHFDPLLRTNDFVQAVKWDRELRARFGAAEEEVLAAFPLSEQERTAIRERDFRRLYELGLHPYLLSQLARLIYGTGEVAGTSRAATALIKSLLGDDYEYSMTGRDE